MRECYSILRQRGNPETSYCCMLFQGGEIVAAGMGPTKELSLKQAQYELSMLALIANQ